MEYLNTYIAPHELLSFSIFEDDHPCNNRLCHAVVTHKGSDSTPLIKGEEIKGDVFKLKIYRQNSTWEDLLRLLSSDIEKLGIDQYRV